MRIRSIEIQNFRALRSCKVAFNASTALIGENNCGKSAVLAALDLFFSGSPKVKEKDFCDGDVDTPIHITVCFSDLTPQEREEFGGNLLDGELIVTRKLLNGNPKESGQFFISAKVNPEFSECRNEEGKNERKKIYKALQKKFELPDVSSADEIDAHLENWEANNSDACKVEKVAGFKGWKNVAVGKLRQKTDFILVRAVEDAAENIDADKNSPVRTLINTIARQTIENSADYQAFMKEANERIAQLTDPNKVPVLAEISDRLTNILEGYYKDSGIIATWQPITQIPPSFPTAAIEVSDNDFVTSIDGVGHGLQRAVILTVLQFMAEHRATSENGGKKFSEAQSDIIIAIEEPEIYQHPTKQRLFAKLLRSLASAFNEETGIRIQTVYVTHSPLMVSLTQCESIRMVRRCIIEDKKNVVIGEISLKKCSLRSAEVSGRTPEQAWSAEQYGAKLHTFDTELAEGFFAKCVLLVEGVGDKAVVEAWYRLNKRDPHAEGLVICDVTGKNNLDKPIIVFEALGIPCYWIFDNDRSDGEEKQGSIKANKILQRLSGFSAEKCVEWPEGITPRFAAWDYKLEEYVKGRAGEELFEKTRSEIASDLHIHADTCLKFPASAAAMLFKLSSAGVKFPELDGIMGAIDNLL